MSLFDMTMPQLDAVAEEMTIDFTALESAPAGAQQQQHTTTPSAPQPTASGSADTEKLQLGQSYPPPSSSGSTTTQLKRLSLPTSILPPSTSSSLTNGRPAHSRQSSLSAITNLGQPAAAAEGTARRRSHSPSRLAPRAQHHSAPVPLARSQQQRAPHNRSTSLSLNGSAGSLLAADPDAQLRTRHATLEKQYSSLKLEHDQKLFRATARITALETALEAAESIKAEADSWESEARKLADEVARAERRAKDAVVVVAAKASQDLDDERDKKKRYKGLNEKLRLELVARRLANRWDIGMIDAEDRKRDSEQVKLEVDLVRAEMARQLAELEVDEAREVAARKVSQLTKERAQLLSKQLALNTAAEKRSHSLEKDVERLEKQIELAAVGEHKADAKAAADARKALDKERAKREKAEDDARELKAALRAAQDELKAAQKATVSVVVPAKSKKAPMAAPVPSDAEEEDVVEAEEEEPKPTRKPKKAAQPAAPQSDSDEDVDSAVESYQPQKSRSRAVPMAKKRAKPTSADPASEVDEQPAKQAKAVLAEKTTNLKPSKAAAGPAAEKKKAKSAVVVKEVVAAAVAEDEPVKKKMRKLFGGPKKFDWGAIENADVNALGLPSSLSPVKGLGAAPKLGGGALSAFGIPRKNIFGGAA